MEKEQIIAIDIGYGDTKIKTETKEFKIPTAVSKLNESFVEFGKTEGYLFNGKRYEVGEKALNKAYNTRSFNFLVNYAQLIIYKSIELAELDLDKPIQIKTGLSLFNWKDKKQFIESIKTINVNDVIIKPSISLMAQGEGVFREYDGDKDGIVCVADMGYNTFDFLVFDCGIPKIELSFANSMGVNRIITDLKARLQKKYNFDISEQAVKKAFGDGYIMNFGEEVDLSIDIEDSKKEYAKTMYEELSSNANNILQSASKIIFSGGGAYFFDNIELKKNMMLSQTPYEFSNVRGYFKS